MEAELWYESDAVFVNVYHGRASFEIGVEIGRLDHPDKYGLTYIVSWAGKEAWEREGLDRHTMFQVSTREGVKEFVPKIAQLVGKYGPPFLRGNSAFYDELEEVNERRVIEYEQRQRLEAIRKKAEAAWRTKDYAQVIELFDPARKHLTDIEVKKLAYAKQQVMTDATVSYSPSRRKR